MKSTWVSNLPVAGVWEVWEQTLNTRARQLFRRSVAGGRGQVVSQCCEQRAGSWAGTGPAGSEVRLHSAELSPGPTCAHLTRDRRHEQWAESNKLRETQEERTPTWTEKCLSQVSKCHMTQQTDLVHSFRIKQGMSRWHIGQIKSYDSRDDQQLFLDSSL